MAKYLLGFSLLLVFSAAQGEIRDWERIAYKKESPNQLAIYGRADPRCPITEDEIEKTSKGVLIRSRIKPLSSIETSDHLHLNITVSCFADGNSNPVYAITARFGRLMGEDLAFAPMTYDLDYGRFGVGPKDSILDAVKDSVEAAITTYLEANFDLSEDNE